MEVGQLATVQRAGFNHPEVPLFLSDDFDDDIHFVPLEDGTHVLVLDTRSWVGEAGERVKEFKVLANGTIGWVSDWLVRAL